VGSTTTPTDGVPELLTPRLRLRGFASGDADALAAMYADSEVMRFLGGVIDREESWRKLALHVGHWALRGYGNWAVERRSDGVFLGRAGLWNPEGWPGLEVGWKFARHAWGQGFATEAGRAALDWAWSSLDVARIISLIHPENTASVRVAERLGMTRAGETTLRDKPVVVFEALRA
jgi:RimJ/RimL family protein N-acetyltransferase